MCPSGRRGFRSEFIDATIHTGVAGEKGKTQSHRNYRFRFACPAGSPIHTRHYQHRYFRRYCRSTNACKSLAFYFLLSPSLILLAAPITDSRSASEYLLYHSVCISSGAAFDRIRNESETQEYVLRLIMGTCTLTLQLCLLSDQRYR